MFIHFFHSFFDILTGLGLVAGSRKRVMASNVVFTFWVVGAAAVSHSGTGKKPPPPVLLRLCMSRDKEHWTSLRSYFLTTDLLLLV